MHIPICNTTPYQSLVSASGGRFSGITTAFAPVVSITGLLRVFLMPSRTCSRQPSMSPSTRMTNTHNAGTLPRSKNMDSPGGDRSEKRLAGSIALFWGTCKKGGGLVKTCPISSVFHLQRGF